MFIELNNEASSNEVGWKINIKKNYLMLMLSSSKGNMLYYLVWKSTSNLFFN